MTSSTLISTPIDTIPAVGWEHLAACAAVTPAVADTFFSDEPGDIGVAKRVCAACPCASRCLEGALDRREQYGVWGGQLFVAGRVLLSKRGKGRPPKVPRPEDLLPMVEVEVGLRTRVAAIAAIGDGIVTDEAVEFAREIGAEALFDSASAAA